ncbi:MAG: hypothetical protein SF187_29945 [Deltaproteobacteria bacterium]|nr:hypothetical protein [Deltaproteobacteria bacterium]
MMCGPQLARAGAPENLVAVEYETDPQAQCPSAAQVQAAVQREAVNATISSAAALRATLKVARDDLGLHATIAIREAQGGEQALRQIDGAHDRCIDLVRVFAVLVALQVQKHKNQPAKTVAPHRAVSKPRPLAANAVPATTKPVPKPQANAVLVEPAPAVPPVATKPRPAFAVWGGPTIDGTPNFTRMGGLLGVAFGLTPHWRAVVEPYGAWGHKDVQTGAFDAPVLGGAVAACWLPWIDARVTLWLCPDAAAEVMFVRGQNVDVPQSDATFLARIGADVRASWAINGPWFAMVKLQGGIHLRTPRVFLDNQAVWAVPRGAGNLAITIGYRF